MANPQYTVSYFNEVYSNKEHSVEEKIQRGILSIYNYLKYDIHNTYENFANSIFMNKKLHNISMNKNYSKYIKVLEAEKLFTFEFMLFSIGLMIWDKDSKVDRNIEPTASFRLLVLAHEKKINISFEEAMNIILSNDEYNYNHHTGLSEKEYFDLTYKLLVK